MQKPEFPQKMKHYDPGHGTNLQPPVKTWRFNRHRRGYVQQNNFNFNESAIASKVTYYFL